MVRPTSKTELISAATQQYAKLQSLISPKWVGGSTLGSYFVSCTSSHYDWAMKKLKAHQKNCKNQ